MFTGIVEEIGKVQGIRRGERSLHLQSPDLWFFRQKLS